MYDILVVGGGPGGLAAGIYGSRARLKTAILEKGRPGGQAASTMEMENYPGFYEETTGPQIMRQFQSHAEHFGTVVLKGLAVDVDFSGPIKKVTTQAGETYQAHSVILAPGAEPRSLNVPGEGKLRGKGVSYCATCDADFFEELDVVVVGNGDAAIEEAMYLTKFAESVTIIVIHDEGVLDCNKMSAERAFENPKIRWLWNSVLDEIQGDELVEGVVVKNIKTGALTDLEVNGVFFFVGTVPKTDFLKGKIELDEQGYIPTNELMETNVPGVYAVGDARVKYLRQVVTAAADGAIASVAAEKYLHEMELLKTLVLEAEKPVVILFWAPQIEESIEVSGFLELELEKMKANVALVKFDVYRNKKTADIFNISHTPTVLFVEGGQEKGRIEGLVTEETLSKLLAKLK
ncbi:MAG: thioredoxin-disulfide reductase [Oscillospiraceae bacterium]|nr:thioredoxin-disulfide reductase [Oscillospiraceae bacterium]